LSEIQLESECRTALDKALTHLTATQKTEREIRDFLTKKGYLPATVEYVLEKLRGYDFVNDGEYAKSYVAAKSSKKGERLIRMELRAKGIADEDAAEALSEIDEETQLESAKTVLLKYMRGKEMDASTLQKAYRHLLSKGYSYEVAKSALSALGDVEEY
jgi:regulatory protein